MIDPSQARYRSAYAIHRLANALGIQLRVEEEECVCLERLASQAERWASFDALAPEPTRDKAYAAGYGSDTVQKHEGEP